MAPMMACVQVSKSTLTSLRLQENGRIAAVGAADGTTSVLRLSTALMELQTNEKHTFSAVRPPDALTAPQHRFAEVLRLKRTLRAG